MCMNVYLHMCVCTVCVPGACGAQKRVPDPLILGLQAAMWMLENEPWSPARAASAPNSQATSLVFLLYFELKQLIFNIHENFIPYWPYMI